MLGCVCVCVLLASPSLQQKLFWKALPCDEGWRPRTDHSANSLAAENPKLAGPSGVWEHVGQNHFVCLVKWRVLLPYPGLLSLHLQQESETPPFRSLPRMSE